MKLPVLSICIFAMSMVACKKDKDYSKPYGLYTEVTPTPGNTTLKFLSHGWMIRGENGSNFKDTFQVTITENKITLKPVSGNTPAAVTLDFRHIDDRSFEIEFLGPMIPEAPKSFMLFRK